MSAPPAAPVDSRAHVFPIRFLTFWALLLPIVSLPALLIGTRSVRDVVTIVVATAVALLAVRLARGPAFARLAAALEKPAPLLVALVALAFAVSGALRGLASVASFHDLSMTGLFAQSFWSTLHGRLLVNSAETVNGGLASHFGIHFSPTLLLVLPFFALWPGAGTLLVVQSVALAAAAIPLFALVRRRVGGGGALLIASALLVTPLFAQAGSGDFHDSCFLCAPLLAALWALEAGRRGWLALFVLLFLGVREDTGLTVAMLGVYALLRRRGRGTALALFLGGLAWFGIATRVIIPHFGSPAIVADPRRFFVSAFGQWGATPGAAILGVLLHPVQVIRWLATRELVHYAYGLFLPFLLLPPFLDTAIVVAMPALAINLLSRFSFMHAATEPYSYLPLCVLAAAVGGLAARIAARAPVDRHAAIGLAAGVVILAGVLPATSSLTPTPATLLPAAVARKVVAAIPERAAVYVPNPLLAALARREHVDNAWNTTAVPHDAAFRARYDWIVVWLATEPRDSALTRDLAKDPRFEELSGYSPLRVWRRR